MNRWKFYDFLDSRGINVIRTWLDTLPPKAAAKIDVRILTMQAMEVETSWPQQYISSITGMPGILELRVASFGGQYRPLGFYGPGRREFTIVLGAIEKGKLRKATFELADNNRKIVLADRNRIRLHEFKRGPDSQPRQ